MQLNLYLLLKSFIFGMEEGLAQSGLIIKGENINLNLFSFVFVFAFAFVFEFAFKFVFVSVVVF